MSKPPNSKPFLYGLTDGPGYIPGRRRRPPPPAPLTEAEIAAQKLKYRRIIWTVAFAAVIITGSIYGAGLKTQREWKQEKEKVEQASAEQRIAMLEQHRMDLVRKKREIEAKLAEVRARFQQPPPEQ